MGKSFPGVSGWAAYYKHYYHNQVLYEYFLHPFYFFTYIMYKESILVKKKWILSFQRKYPFQGQATIDRWQGVLKMF